MKITKTLVSVFLLTFLIGYVSDLPIKKRSVPKLPEPTDIPRQFENVMTENPSEPTKENKFEPEIIINTEAGDVLSKFKYELLEVGDGIRKEDVKAKSGEIWMGLFKREDNYFLRSERIKVYPTTKPDYIEDSKTVAVSGKDEPLVLIGKAKKLRPGEVKTLFSRPSNEEIENSGRDESLLTRRFVREFTLGERKYSLRIKQAVNQDNDKYLALVLETENTSQIVEYCLYYEEDAEKFHYEEFLGNLIWAGDLDRDGKLDLYLEYNTHERGYGTILLLSSEAQKGELLESAAVYSPTGC